MKEAHYNPPPIIFIQHTLKNIAKPDRLATLTEILLEAV